MKKRAASQGVPPPVLDLVVETVSAGSLRPDPGNPRLHSKRQLVAIAASIREYGPVVPLLIDEDNLIIAGHGRLEAMQSLGMTEIPCFRLRHLSSDKKRALALADNKIHDLSSWDEDKLAQQLKYLCSADYNCEVTGFSTGEIDALIDAPAIAAEAADPLDTFEEPDPDEPIVSRLGEVWVLGPHRIFAGNALEAASYEVLLQGRQAQMVFADGPYNIPIEGHASGGGKVKHRDFAMGVGEMSHMEFTDFQHTFMKHCEHFSVDGSIHYHCMGAVGLEAVLAAGREVYAEQKAICIWLKTNAGNSAFYRWQHEHVVVFKKGSAPHINNIQFGKWGRFRSTAWQYPGCNTFRKGRAEDLAAHPTVKNWSMVADAIRDCSRKNGVILDPFLGSGTTILAAHRTGRIGMGIELDPLYVDVAIRRWEALAGSSATLLGDGRTFAEVAEARGRERARG